jgi:hypothetical protein
MVKGSKSAYLGRKLIELQRQAAPAQALNRYHVAAETAREIKRLSSNEAHQERLVRDYFREHFKRPEVEVVGPSCPLFLYVKMKEPHNSSASPA